MKPKFYFHLALAALSALAFFGVLGSKKSSGAALATTGGQGALWTQRSSTTDGVPDPCYSRREDDPDADTLQAKPCRSFEFDGERACRLWNYGKLWRTFSYRIDGDVLRINDDHPGDDISYDFAVQGDTLTLTGVLASGQNVRSIFTRSRLPR